MSENHNKKIKFLSIVSVVLLIIIAILGYSLYQSNQKAQAKSTSDPFALNAKEETPENPFQYSKPSARKSTFTLRSQNNNPTWDPYTEIERMQDYMNQLFSMTMDRFSDHNYDDDFQRFNFNLNGEIEEDSRYYVFNFSIPNVKSESIDVSVSEKQLTLKGLSEESVEETDPEGNIIHSETQSTSFLRTIDFPEKVDPNSLEKKIENGILQIKLKKLNSKEN
ncbi:MAG: hypothetical protein C5B43_03715 [Verrucomicrobia bacterium]|nr:MAG: hypothetical protein C5B43_03715 [Verrucomicrobiota bacterium]